MAEKSAHGKHFNSVARATILTKLKKIKKSKYFTLSYYRNNISFFFTILIYFVIQIILAIIQYFLYIESNLAVRFARIGGILLNFNSSLIVLLVLRRLVTWLRNSLLGRNFLPVDNFIKFHKFIGIFILFFSILHTVAHCINLCKPLNLNKKN